MKQCSSGRLRLEINARAIKGAQGRGTGAQKDIWALVPGDTFSLYSNLILMKLNSILAQLSVRKGGAQGRKKIFGLWYLRTPLVFVQI